MFEQTHIHQGRTVFEKGGFVAKAHVGARPVHVLDLPRRIRSIDLRAATHQADGGRFGVPVGNQQAGTRARRSRSRKVDGEHPIGRSKRLDQLGRLADARHCRKQRVTGNARHGRSAGGHERDTAGLLHTHGPTTRTTTSGQTHFATAESEATSSSSALCSAPDQAAEVILGSLTQRSDAANITTRREPF